MGHNPLALCLTPRALFSSVFLVSGPVMPKFEYRAVPAPLRAARKRDLAHGDDAYCAALADILNELADDGWEYLRSDTLRVRTGGLFSRRVEDRSLLICRREVKPLYDASPQPELVLSAEKVRARRVRSEKLVDLVRDGGRKISARA